jgi:hypothetical protein
MTSRHSDSLVLVWQVAAVEARYMMHSKIEPEHLFLGLCKAVDVEIPDLVSKTLPNRNDVLEECLREIRRLRNVFKVSGVDATILRRRLRASYGKDSLEAVEAGPLHRSERARKVFFIAERFADLTNFVVFPVHLLHAVLSVDDTKRDSAMAGLGVDKEALVRLAKAEMFNGDNVDAVRRAAQKTKLN